MIPFLSKKHSQSPYSLFLVKGEKEGFGRYVLLDPVYLPAGRQGRQARRA